MKRKIMGFVAVIIAVALSAFTAPQNQQSQNVQPDLFWYTIDNNGELVGPINSSPVDKDTQMLSANCHDETEVECLVGTDSDQDEGQSLAIVPTDRNYHITEDFNR